MELKIKTTELQEMVGKAITGASNNVLLPITSLMNIKVKNNIITLTTTDGTNYFYVSSSEKIDCENFEVSVIADLFTKLIQKTTSENVELIFNNNNLVVKGNGEYKIELPLDENGGIIKFPKKYENDFRNDFGIIHLSTVKTLLNFNKPSLAVNVGQVPSLTCYYCADSVVSTDRKKICKTAIKMFDKPMLLTSQFMDLLGVMTDEEIHVTTTDNDMLFFTSKETLFAPITEGVETFPIAAVNTLIDSAFSSNCKVPRVAVVDLLDRLSLFVTKYDKKGIYLTFTKDGILFSSKKSSGTELIPYVASVDFKDFTCCVDIETLKSQINAQDGEIIDMYYGADIAIKMVCNNITQIVALQQDDRAEE